MAPALLGALAEAGSGPVEESHGERERIRRMTQRIEQLVPDDGEAGPAAGTTAGNG